MEHEEKLTTLVASGEVSNINMAQLLMDSLDITVEARREILSKLPATKAMDLPGVDLRHASLLRRDLGFFGLKGAQLDEAELSGATLLFADLTGATLRGATLRNANLSRSCLAGADLTGACLDGASLRGADLRGATLVDVSAEGADLDGAQLPEGVRLSGTATLELPRFSPELPDDAKVVCPSGGGDYRTISQALEGSPGGRLILRPGLYRESVKYVGATSAPVELIAEEPGMVAWHGVGAEPLIVSRGIVRVAGVMLGVEGGQGEHYTVHVKGGDVTLEGCIVDGASYSSVVAEGSTSRLMMRQCTVRDAGQTGVWGQRGARIDLVDCLVVGSRFHGLQLEGGAEGELRACRVLQSRLQCVSAKGTAKQDPAKLRVVQSQLKHSRTGSAAHVVGSAKLELVDCRLEETYRACVLAKGDAHVRMSGCELLSSETGSGLFVFGHAGAEVEDCRLENNHLANVELAEDGRLTMVGSQCLASQTGSGVLAHARAVVSLERCELRRNERANIALQNQSIGRLAECTLSESRAGGGLFVCESARLEVKDCTFEDNHMAHVEAKGQATGTLTACRMARSGVSSGANLREKAQLTFVDCQQLDAGVRGWIVSDEAVLTMRGTTTVGAADCCLRVSDQARANLDRCSLSKSEKAVITVHDEARLVLSHCELSQSITGGALYAYGHASVLVRASTLWGTHRATVEASDQSKLALHDTELRGSVEGSGMFVYGQSDVQMFGCRLIDNHLANLESKGDGRVEATDCTFQGSVGGHGIYARERSHLIIRGGVLADNAGRGARTLDEARLTLAGVALRDNKEGAVLSESTHEMNIEHCTRSEERAPTEGAAARKEGTDDDPFARVEDASEPDSISDPSERAGWGFGWGLLRRPWLWLGLGLVAILLVFGTPSTDPARWYPPVNQGFSGDFAVNDDLSAVEVYTLDGWRAGEDIAVDAQGVLHVGVSEGALLQVDDVGEAPTVWRWSEGRPLGMHFDSQGNLLVAVASRGLMSMPPEGATELLVSVAERDATLFLDDLDVTSEDVVYVSEASLRFPYESWELDILESQPNGRLIRYDPASQRAEVVLGDLFFANGVAIDPREQFVLVVETSRYRVRRLWIAGPRAGEHEVWIDNLPGFPDGISAGTEGLFWLALASPRDPMLDALGPHPWVRWLLAKLPSALHPAPTRYGHVVGLDRHGRVRCSLQHPSGGRFAMITSVEEHDDWLYLGSLSEPAWARLKVPARCRQASR